MRCEFKVKLLLIKAVGATATITPGDDRKGAVYRVYVLGLVDSMTGKRWIGSVYLRGVRTFDQMTKPLDILIFCLRLCKNICGEEKKRTAL